MPIIKDATATHSTNTFCYLNMESGCLSSGQNLRRAALE